MEKVIKPIVLNETFSEKLNTTNDFLSAISESCKTISADVPKVTTGTSADGSTTITVENKDGSTTTELVDGIARSSVDSLSSNVNTRMSAIETEQSVQSARIDTFTSLPEGSTSGNAELADIRVGADGTTYDTAGNAVRGQIGELKSDIVNLSEAIADELNESFDVSRSSNLLDTDKITIGAAMIASGKTYTSADYSACGLTDYIPVNAGDVLAWQGVLNGYTDAKKSSIFSVCAFDKSKNVLAEKGTNVISDSYTVPNGVSYVRLTLRDYIYRSSRAMVHFGAEVMPYEPFYVKKILKRNVHDEDYIRELISEQTHDIQDSFEEIASTNLLNPNTTTDGVGINSMGNEISGEGFILTDYIPVNAGDVLAWQGVLNGYTDATIQKFACVAAYDANKDIVASAGTNTAVMSYTVPNGVSYVRVTLMATQYFIQGTLMVHFGAEVMPYEPYYDAYLLLKNKSLDEEYIMELVGDKIEHGVNDWIDKNQGAITLQTASPRAQVKQILVSADGYEVAFEDVYVVVDNNVSATVNLSKWIYGLEAHKTNSTTQRVFRSNDGETWKEYASLTIDAANGIWITNLFVDHRNNIIYGLKTTDGWSRKNNYVCSYFNDGTKWHQKENPLSLGSKIWLGNNNCIDVCTSPDWSVRSIIFGEYGTTTDGTTYALWRSTNGGTSWEKVLELGGDFDGATGKGEIRHWHTVQADPYTKHWWATSGDTNRQCQIYRSTDNGVTWELMFSGSQRERTCGFVFEQDCIYYGMDSTNNTDSNSIKIVKIDKNKLENDRENAREDVAVVDSAFAVYGLSRTYYPDGFIIWSQQEPGASFTPGRYILQFYDYGTKKLYPIACFDTSDIANSQYIGFYAGARVQHNPSGIIFAKPTRSLHQDKYGDNGISTHIKINITM